MLLNTTGWHLAHPFIYVVDCSTDDNGWQYFHHTHSSNNNRESGKGPNSDSNDETTSSTQVEEAFVSPLI